MGKVESEGRKPPRSAGKTGAERPATMEDGAMRADHPCPLPRGFQRFDMPGQFLRRRPTLEVQADHLERSPGRLASGPQAHQQRSEHGYVDLQGDAWIGGAQPVRASQDALEATEKQLNLPRTLQAKTQHSSLGPAGRSGMCRRCWGWHVGVDSVGDPSVEQSHAYRHG